MINVKKVILLTLCGTFLFAVGAFASGAYLVWYGNIDLMNAEARVSQYVNDADNYISRARETIIVLKRNKAKLEKTKADLEKQLANSNSTNNQLLDKISSLEVEINNLETEIEIKNNELERLSKVEEENTNLKQEILSANEDASAHFSTISTIINDTVEIDESIFDDVEMPEFNAKKLKLIDTSEMELSEQTLDMFEMVTCPINYPTPPTSNPTNYSFRAILEGLEVGKTYKISMKTNVFAMFGNISNMATVTNGSNQFVWNNSEDEAQINETFIAESDTIIFEFSHSSPEPIGFCVRFYDFFIDEINE